MSDNPHVIDKLVSFDMNCGDLVIKHSQYIPDEFLSDLRKQREDSLHTPAGEGFHLVGSVPTAVADRWMREGYNIYLEPVTESLKRLRLEQLDGFIASNKV